MAQALTGILYTGMDASLLKEGVELVGAYPEHLVRYPCYHCARDGGQRYGGDSTSDSDGGDGTCGAEDGDGTSDSDGGDGTSGIDGGDGTSVIDGDDGTSGIDGGGGTSVIDGDDGTGQYCFTMLALYIVRLYYRMMCFHNDFNEKMFDFDRLLDQIVMKTGFSAAVEILLNHLSLRINDLGSGIVFNPCPFPLATVNEQDESPYFISPHLLGSPKIRGTGTYHDVLPDVHRRLYFTGAFVDSYFPMVM